MVSGTISLPSRGTFHHSLTVLIHYRSTGSIQAYQVVLADSHGIPRAPCYSGSHSTAAERITTTGLSPSTVNHPRLFVYTPAPHCDVPADTPRVGPQHRTCNPCRVSHRPGLATIRFRSPLLTESQLFSLPAGTEMFHFPAFPLPGLYIQPGVTGLASSRVPPFGNPRITVWLSTPRGLSQVTASFIGS